MIGRLRGLLVAKQPPWIMVEVGGVGYELEVPMSTMYDLPEVGREVILCTHYAVKEDSVALYGFLRESERSLFRSVQKVSGIGAKIALAVLSGASTDDFARLVQTADITALTRIPGIGKKTAERIVVELRDRVDSLLGSASSLSAFVVVGFGNHRGRYWVAERSPPNDSRGAAVFDSQVRQGLGEISIINVSCVAAAALGPRDGAGRGRAVTVCLWPHAAGPFLARQ